MESWSGALNGFSLIANLTKHEGAQQTLLVLILSGPNTWRGSITSQDGNRSESRNGSNCAATRGINPSNRAFALLRAAISKEETVRLVNDITPPRLIVSSLWGSEFGINGVNLPVADVHLDAVDPSDFYAALFNQVANNRDEEQKLHTNIKKLECETDMLRHTDESLNILLPKRREQLVNAMTKALNNFKLECQTTSDFNK